MTSDSFEILDIAATYGARKILRPANISGDRATSEEAWIHAVNQIKLITDVELVVCIQPTSPVRGRHDLDEAIDIYYEGKFDSLLSVTKIEDHFEWRLGKSGAESINYELKDHQDSIVINCASVEYFKSIDRPVLKAEVITPQFKEIKEGKMKMISFFAKRARGMMARFIIQNQINDKNDILAFNLEGYSFDPSISSPNEPVFTRHPA